MFKDALNMIEKCFNTIKGRLNNIEVRLDIIEGNKASLKEQMNSLMSGIHYLEHKYTEALEGKQSSNVKSSTPEPEENCFTCKHKTYEWEDSKVRCALWSDSINGRIRCQHYA